MAQYDYPGWAVVEWECCIKHPEAGRGGGREVCARAYHSRDGSGVRRFCGRRADAERIGRFWGSNRGIVISRTGAGVDARTTAGLESGATNRRTTASRFTIGEGVFPGATMPYFLSRNSCSAREADAASSCQVRTFRRTRSAALFTAAITSNHASRRSGRRSSWITQKLRIRGVCGQHVADELIACVALLRRADESGSTGGNERGIGDDAFEFLRIVFGKFAGAHPARGGDLDARQAVAVEDYVEVAVGFDDGGGARLEIQLRSAWPRPAASRSACRLRCGRSGRWRAARAPSSRRSGRRSGVDAERVAHRCGLRDAGRAEDVHQQRVGAHGGVELAPAAGGVDLRLGSERAAWAWTLSKRRIQSGRARMAA